MIPPKPQGVRWTDDQWRAIYTRNQGLLLSAAAGSGKTAVLIERILQRLLDPSCPIDVDQLVVTTFTDAAATEMRHRLREALDRAIQVEETNENAESTDNLRHLRRQLSLLPRATIATLHSFCKSVLQKYFYRIGLDPSFRVASESDLVLLRQDVLEQVLEDAYVNQPAHAPFWQMVSVWSGRSDDKQIGRRVLAMYEQARSQPWPGAWMEALAADYRNGDLSRWIDSITQHAFELMNACLWRIEQAMSLVEHPEGPAYYLETIQSDQQMIRSMMEQWAADFDSGLAALIGWKWARLKSKPKQAPDGDPTLTERFKQSRDGWKAAFDKWRKQMTLFMDGAAREDIAEVAPLIVALVELTQSFGQAYTTAKTEKGWIDFSDLEHLTLRVLCLEASDPSSELVVPDTITPSEAALELRAQLVEVMVDEYQDTNRVQETIIHLLTSATDEEERSGAQRFMVGDVKQSIYRFRLAEPGLFLGHEQAYLAGQGGERIVLSQNFRSRPLILESINGLFRQLMGGGAAEIVYDEQAELKPGLLIPELSLASGQTAAQSELVVMLPLAPDVDTVDATTAFDAGSDPDEGESDSESSDEEMAEDWQQWSTTQREGAWMASRIREWMALDGQGREPLRIFDPKRNGERNLQFGDIVILLRSMATHSTTIVEALRNAGIPADADVRENWFEAPEVLSTFALLDILDNRKQDIALAAVLRSGYFAWDETLLAGVRIGHEEQHYHEAFDSILQTAMMGRTTGESLSDLQIQTLYVSETLDRWTTLRHRMAVDQLLWTIWEESGYYVWQGGLPGGSQRQANLLAMIELASQADNMGEGGLYPFLQRIRRMQRQSLSVDAARVQDEQGNVVRVMSIHKSKGLEFPVVFVARMAGLFNEGDTRATFAMHRDLGCGTIWMDPSAHVRRLTLPLQAIRNRVKVEQLAEELRVLYVALTRARDHLVLIASPKGTQKKLAAWRAIGSMQAHLLPHDIWIAARSYWEWIAPALLRHRDAEALREWMDVDEPERGNIRPEDEGQWRMTLVPAGALPEPSIAAVAEIAELPTNDIRVCTPISNMTNAGEVLASLLTWKDPLVGLTKPFSKVTVSRLREGTDAPTAKAAFRWEAPDEPGTNPYSGTFDSALGDQGHSGHHNGAPAGKLRGTAVHQLMQRINRTWDWDQSDALNRLQGWIEEEVASRRLDVEVANAIDPSQLLRYLQSPLGQRFRAAEKVWREQPFSLTLPVQEVYPELTDEWVLVQGIIDVMWKESDGLIIVDYKTDRVRSLSAIEWNERQTDYIDQVRWYRRAVEESTGQQVKATYLYLMETGEVVSA